MEAALKQVLASLVQDPALQVGFLEALSELENCGAKKIMGYATRSNTDLSLLQHAAEETRHAYFFKKQASRVGVIPKFSWLNGKSRRYLDRLELFIARCLQDFPSATQKEGCYVLTTYYIEQRATWLYTHYEAILRAQKSDFSLQSILKEEIGHLAEMERKKETLGLSPDLAARIQDFEATLCAEWIAQMKIQLYACGG